MEKNVVTGYEFFLTTWILVGTAISLALAVIASARARKKGRRPWLWAILGLLFGVFAIIALSRIGSTSVSERSATNVGGLPRA